MAHFFVSFTGGALLSAARRGAGRRAWRRQQGTYGQLPIVLERAREGKRACALFPFWLFWLLRSFSSISSYTRSCSMNGSVPSSAPRFAEAMSAAMGWATCKMRHGMRRSDLHCAQPERARGASWGLPSTSGMGAPEWQPQ